MLTLALAGTEVARTALTGNLPDVNGRIALHGLEHTVVVSRSDEGVPTVRGESLEDVARAQGFVHAQDRFFQMDLLRRYSAGRLAEVMGPAVLALDQNQRPSDFQRRAEQLLPSLPDRHVRLLEAYAAGVNAGLAELEAPPFEYAVLGVEPEPWRARDSVLVGLTMFDMLAFGRTFERQRTTMALTLHPDVYAFLTPRSSRSDATLTEGLKTTHIPVDVPGPDVLDLRDSETTSWNQPVFEDPVALGSNNLAIAGQLTTHGGAILSNDMHLGLTVPNIWYRAALAWPGHIVRGVTLPGAPGMIVGTNTRIAWGFTNVTGDEQDFIAVDVDPSDPTRYLVPEGTEPFGEVTHTLGVRGGDPVTLTLRTTRWGPVTEHDASGRPLVMKWSATEPGGFNFEILDMMVADTIEEAISTAQRWHGPPQNVTVADNTGRVGWTISGYIPRRRGFDGSIATSWADGARSWRSPLPSEQHPSIIDPPSGYIFTANNRTLPFDRSTIVSDHFMPPDRARRIIEQLEQLSDATETDVLSVILDTRAQRFDPYRDLILKLTTPEDPVPELARAHQVAAGWNGHADVDQRAFLLLVRFQSRLRARLLTPLLAPCLEADPDFRYNWPLADECILRILEERPQHFLPRAGSDWHAYLRDILLDTVAQLQASGEFGVPWGDVNRPGIQHPFSRVMPGLGQLLDMPDMPMPGHVSTVRVQASGFGASERLVVSPGREIDGILHMPTGQSGHPLSPWYRAGHADWIHGRPTPLISRRVAATLILTP